MKSLKFLGILALALILSLSVIGCPDDGGGGNNGDGNDDPSDATALTDNVWETGGEIDPEGDEDWYEFTAVSGDVYYLNWDDGYGMVGITKSGSYTGDIRVSAYESDGITPLSGIIGIDNAYTTPRVISGYSGTVYIKVVGFYPATTTGTYAIKYRKVTDNNNNPAAADTLTEGSWHTGDIYPATDEDWYKFTATSGNTYNLNWDDSYGIAGISKSGNYTVDIRVSAYESDGITPLNGISGIDSGYAAPQVISGYAGTVYIKVYGLTGYSTGTYAIKYVQNP
jgi:hypothetical protein